VTKGGAENNMRMETKYLRLPTPVTLGSRFDSWRVCWLGGWAKHRMFYLVMVVRVLPDRPRAGLRGLGTEENILPEGGS
jgi:hypothetical protein